MSHTLKHTRARTHSTLVLSRLGMPEGHAKEPATETTASPGLCCKHCHSNKEVRFTSLPFSMSYTGYLLKCVLTTKSCLLSPCCMNGIAPHPPTPPHCIGELIPRDLPVRHLRSSTRSRLRILSIDSRAQTNKTLWSQSIFQSCTQTVEQSAHCSERA